jgi:hypothetical protein
MFPCHITLVCRTSEDGTSTSDTPMRESDTQKRGILSCKWRFQPPTSMRKGRMEDPGGRITKRGFNDSGRAKDGGSRGEVRSFKRKKKLGGGQRIAKSFNDAEIQIDRTAAETGLCIFREQGEGPRPKGSHKRAVGTGSGGLEVG